MNKSFGVLSFIAALSLAACGGGGGGGSSLPAVVYPMSGTYAGTLVNSSGAAGNMGLAIQVNGSTVSGDFVLAFSGQQEAIVEFASPNAVVNGNTLSIAGNLNVPGTGFSCPTTLTANMVGPNELKGSYRAGDNKADCDYAPPTTVTFDLTRQQLQDIQRTVKTLHAAGSI